MNWGRKKRKSDLAPTKKNKYNNTKVEVAGYKFDSKKEARRFKELYLLLKAKEIYALSLQPEFEIAKRVFDNSINRWLPARKYIADFKYFDLKSKKWIVEDVKSAITKKDSTYRLKRHLFLERYGEKYEFREI